MDARPLSQVLREATAEAHKSAERHAFVIAMLRGSLSLEAYAQHLASLQTVYAALERALAPGSPLADPALFRAAAIQRDLDALNLHPGPTGAALRWAAHLAGLPQHGLAGHAYTRYLGDLSGGQQIGRRLVSTGMLPEGATQTYRFPQIPDIKAYKARFRSHLDTLGERLGDAGRALVVEEARNAFRWSADIFEEAGHR